MQGMRKLFVAVLATAVLLGMGSIAFAQSDGNVDILWRNNNNGIPVVWYMNGYTYVTYASMTISPYTSVSTAWQINGLNDFDQDGHTDLLWRNTSGNGIPVVWLMNNRTYVTWKSTSSSSVSSVFHIGATSDINNDGNADIMWRNMNNGIPVAWYMNHYTYVTWQTTTISPYTSVSTRFTMSGMADFDKDGHDDILWHNSGNGIPLVWLMNGNTYVTWKTMTEFSSISTVWSINGIGDFNKDGNQDIMWRNRSNGLPIVWLMNGYTYVTWQSTSNYSSVSTSTFGLPGAAEFGAY